MIVKNLLDKIKDLEDRIDNIKNSNEIVKNNIIEIFKQVKIDKNKKDLLQKKLISNLNKLNVKYENRYFNDNLLEINTFIKVSENLNDFLMIAIKCPEDLLQCKFLSKFVSNKYSHFFTKYKDILIGIIDKEKIDEIKKLNNVPYYNPQTDEFKEIEIFKLIVETDIINISNIMRIYNLVREFSVRPSFKNKHFIEYSLISNRIIDFEEEKIKKEKEKYKYIYEEPYPNLELKVKKNINNIPFILTILERIDKEIKNITSSKGLINIVNRILNYIEVNTPDPSIRESAKHLKKMILNN